MFRDGIHLVPADLVNELDAKLEELQALVGKAMEFMADVSPDLLRRSEVVRDTVAQGFGSIKAELDRMMVDKPKRAIRFEDG